jgi:guanylate cyclase
MKRAILSRIHNIGVEASDAEELRLRKSLLVTCSLTIAVCALIWGAIYLFFGEPLAAFVPWSYAVASAIGILIFARNRKFEPYLFGQLLLILLLPFTLQLTLGGFVNSSAVVLWSLICPLGALVFAGPRRAQYWFVGFLLLTVFCAIVQPYLRVSNNLSRQMIILFFALNIGAISGIVFLLLRSFIQQRDVAYELLRAEQKKSDDLLLNILPKEIADTLKQRGGIIADYYADVSVLFADIVNFTPLSAQLSPQTMVGILDEIFSYFDSLMDKHGVEKIETVGDEYMAACGVPRTCPGHAVAITRVALDMRDYMRDFNQRHAAGPHRLDIRIGIHSGPVVGGVIGRKKFAFELFGDTVNTANRMQSHGEADKIQITQRTYELIADEFFCEHHGNVPIKGKGEMETWFVIASRADSGR